ncbi:hypothetical protein PJL18_03377 [Paenarthrobacter nicotinovorans]|nr:hypothetical protein [Paenarthrobacter nicotinovorans]
MGNGGDEQFLGAGDALRAVERRFCLVPREDLPDFAFARAHNDQLVVAGEFLEHSRGHLLDAEIATGSDERLNPQGAFDPLVDGAGSPVQGSCPFDGFFRVHPELDGGDGRDCSGFVVFGEGGPHLCLGTQGRGEHALAGHDFPGADLGCGTVGQQCHCVAFPLQAQGQLGAGFTGAHDCYLSHDGSFLACLCQKTWLGDFG